MNKNTTFTRSGNNGGNNEDAFRAKNDNQENGFKTNNSRQNTAENKIRVGHVELSLTMQKGFFDNGWKVGIDSGDVEPNPNIITIVGDLAKATAEAAHRENFNPENSLHDKHREEEYEKWCEELVEAKRALLNEKSKLKEMDTIASKARASTVSKPKFPIGIVAAGIPLITLTVAYTLYDSFISSLGFILALTFSVLTGLSWGAFIIYLILHVSDSNETKISGKNWIGLVCGIGMAVSLGFIRFNQSSTEFLWQVIGLTLLESFIVIALDFYAQPHRRSLFEYQAKLIAANEAESDYEATKAEIRRRQERVDELQNKKEEHQRYLEERELLAKNKEQFIASAEKAAVAGYVCACANNKGKNLR
jgi:hypothetical protein